jgi:hypothetical protein
VAAVDLEQLSNKPGLHAREFHEAKVDFMLKDAPDGYYPLKGYPKWQAIPDVACPWDPAVVKAMRELDPSIVPLWVTWAYGPPKGDANKDVFVTGRHAVGWHRPDLDFQDFHVMMPSGPVGGIYLKRPTRLWKIYHVSEENGARIGGFVPWSWWMYYNLREEFSENGSVSMHELMEAKRVRETKKAAQIEEDSRLMRAEADKFIKRKLDNVTDADWKKWLAGGHVGAADPAKVMVDYKLPGPTPRALRSN